MSKVVAVLQYAILLTFLLGASEQHVAITKIDIGDISAFIAQLNRELGLGLDQRVFSHYVGSIVVANEFSEPVDVHYRGIVLTITYSIKKEDPKWIYFYISSFNQDLIDDIRAQIELFFEDRDK